MPAMTELVPPPAWRIFDTLCTQTAMRLRQQAVRSPPCPARSPARVHAAAPWGGGAQPAGWGSRGGRAARSTLGSRWRPPAHRSCGREGDEQVSGGQEC